MRKVRDDKSALMIKMREITGKEEERLWREVREEFPRDLLMQEIHFVRLKLQLQIEGMSPEEQIRYINSFAHVNERP